MSRQESPNMCEWLELYMLGGLSQSEREQMEEHLSHCEACKKEREELQAVTDLLPYTAEPVAVPDGMKQRVLGRILGSEADHSGQPPLTGVSALQEQEQEQAQKDYRVTDASSAAELQKHAGTAQPEPVPAGEHEPVSARRPAGKRSRTFIRRAAGMGIAAAAVILGWVNMQLREDVRSLKGLNASLQQSVSSLQGQLTLAGQPSQASKANKVVKLNPAVEGIVAQGLATIVIDAKGTHLVVQAENLPALRDSQAFQVWLIKGEQKVNAGTFLPQGGSGALYYTFEPQDYDTVAITLEPDAGGTQPRGSLVLAAKI
ncbi:anti-sigma factor domain-containing protein [Paenibacillus chitinolyticus]|uniref:anti-sigma factor domain-containing protein n=1 Tax=Paenibacillus chitinolyticus TaxID=79263 RepID=UPI00367117E3